MSEDQAPKTKARRRGKPIEVWVTDDEKEEIRERAKNAGLSMSGYLRALGLNQPIKSKVDLLAVSDLAKVNGDLGRVAGLLKLWLAEKRGQGARPFEVESMMKDFRAIQQEMLKLMSQVIK
ncbi:plasmid mobilization protein [Acinetobacter sp. DSM 11652]|uniref:plasmid mobilization protein n=1 Tax=Acinetobacter sp. DSM 11652 TaxID=346222 RepID=UPI0008D22B28|nr:CopG family transcriptional regulator [Acinetobacter sp. DSM 11652]SEM30799.1 hypothetical protein SAMN05216500_11925 [Acinetobacter sp. DSM 11652]